MMTPNDTPDAVVLANGEYPVHPLPLRLLRETSPVVCCDGAANDYLLHGGTPHLIIGDGDSLSPANKEAYAHLVYPVSDQETNDQTKAIRYLAERGYRRIAILGATGKREDHTLGNISLLMDYLKEGIEVCMVTDYGVFLPIKDTHTFVTQPGQQFSIINFGATGLRGEGLVYPLSDFTNWWQGTLNEASGTEVTIHASGYYLVFICHPKQG